MKASEQRRLPKSAESCFRLAKKSGESHESQRSQSSISQMLQISGKMWPYLKRMLVGMNACRSAIFTCRRHRQSLELSTTIARIYRNKWCNSFASFLSGHDVFRGVAVMFYTMVRKKMHLFLHMLQLQELDGTTALFVVKLSGDVTTSG